MPFAPTSPANEATPDPPSTTDRDISTFKIERITIVKDIIDDSKKVLVSWVEGYMSGDDFIPVHSKSATIADATLATKMVATVPESTTYYDAIKSAVWDMLGTDGEVPAGSVS